MGELAGHCERLGLSPRPHEGDDGELSLDLHLGPFGARLRWGKQVEASLHRETARQCRVIALPQSPSVGSVDAWLLEPAPTGGQDRVADTQRLCLLAALITPFLQADTLFWPPARLWSSAEGLRDAVITAEAQNIPPILHLVAFLRAHGYSPGRQRLVTDGLAWFVGQEIELSCPDEAAPGEALRRLSRLAIDALVHGPFAEPQFVPGIERGELLKIGAGQNRAGVTVVPVEMALR